MKAKEREVLWQARVQHWRESGLSQRAYALQQGYPIRQMGYWVRRLKPVEPAPAALLPVRVAAPPAAITLRGDKGWTLALPGNVSASWLADLIRAL